MSERVTDQAYWIGANGADDPETAELVQVAVGALGDWGSFVARKEGRGKIVIGPVSTLVLPDIEAEMSLVSQLEAYSNEADG